ncbi:uroporphyrinogen-III C-methyltransferase [Leifsonia shinshuensis]|uniref:uroporphyrinogen-III C-methyltransferase n=1 Tax=Leifsonia shinshuensis TaxID=150026 RepID=UPI00285AA8C2|nr:uroporphyrinogen-III C-methyltransferase [Leifsonia shinshuensis]MDR6972067.1 uroporphyrin-III C-methyltransferase [Leifsonia shinshuensis]
MISRTGNVTLVGGGPGDPDLLTVAAVRALEAADVVLYDRLAPHETLTALAPRAELIDVGKRPGHHPIPQDEIERLLVAHARNGSAVVRLKGGDPFVFGRGGEEVEACRLAGIPVRVIPGVTSAISVPAAAGIPVTHRSMSRLFTVVSGHAPLSPGELEHLAGLGGTIVILMGIMNLPSITAGLARFGMDPQMPVAVVEQGYSARQRTTFGRLSTILTESARAGVGSPAVVVIGEVVRLARDGDAHAAAALADAAAATGP